MIKSCTKFFLIVVPILFLSSCAIPSEQRLSNQDKMNIKSNRILLNSTQREIVMQHNNWLSSELPDPYAPLDSGAIVQHHTVVNPNGGLIGGLIIAGIQHTQAGSALKAIAPVRETLDNFDFLSYFNSELKNNVGKLPWLNVRKQEVKYNVQGSEADNVVASNENTTLFIGTTYALNSIFSKLEVEAYVKLVQKPIANQKPRTLYSNNFHFINHLPEPNKIANQNKMRWIKNDGAKLKTALRDAASLLSNMIAIDIGKTSYATTSNQPITFRHMGMKAKGKLIKRQNGYYIVVSDQTLYAINENDLVR